MTFPVENVEGKGPGWFLARSVLPSAVGSLRPGIPVGQEGSAGRAGAGTTPVAPELALMRPIPPSIGREWPPLPAGPTSPGGAGMSERWASAERTGDNNIGGRPRFDRHHSTAAYGVTTPAEFWRTAGHVVRTNGQAG